MQRKLRNLSRQAPLTPDLYKPAQAPTPDLKVEAALYRALQFERQKTAKLKRQLENIERIMANWRAKKAAKFLARELTKKGKA